jgi:AraC-like DNA-binding protein
MDKLSQLLGRHAFHARVFFNGDFCDTSHFRHNGMSGHLHLVRRGPVEFVHEDGGLVLADEPSLVFYPRGMSHILRIPEGRSASLLCADIVFEEGMANPLARLLPACVHMPLSDAPGLGATLEMLFGEAGRAAPGRELVLDRLCDVLLVQLMRREFDSGRLSPGLLAGLADRQLSLALAAVHERPQEPWTLQTLATVACMSRAAFAEHFRNVVGMPPGEYLSRWRIALGGRLLRQGIPVKLVSEQTGFSSPSTFTRAFTARMGTSPRGWLTQAA